MNRYQQEIAEMDARRQRRVRAFAGLVVVVLVLVLLGLLWALSFRSGDSRPDQNEQHASSPRSPTVVTGDQSQRNEPPKSLPGAESSIAKTAQSLLLVSTSPGRHPREGTARIGTHAENPQTYAAGALLVNGARLAEIHDHYVMLERKGKQTKLYLVNSRQQSDNTLSMVGGEPVPQPPAVTYTDVLANYLRPSPVYDGDRLKGYQLYPGKRSGVFWQMGLQSGDVVLALNDQPFGDPQQAAEAFRQLTTGVALVATIERGGKIERVSLEVGCLRRRHLASLHRQLRVL